jgi:hypothetical protein
MQFTTLALAVLSAALASADVTTFTGPLTATGDAAALRACVDSLTRNRKSHPSIHLPSNNKVTSSLTLCCKQQLRSTTAPGPVATTSSRSVARVGAPQPTASGDAPPSSREPLPMARTGPSAISRLAHSRSAVWAGVRLGAPCAATAMVRRAAKRACQVVCSSLGQRYDDHFLMWA